MLPVLEFVVVMAFLGLTATQIIWPLLVGTPLFPLFRKKKAVDLELQHTRQRLEEATREAEKGELEQLIYSFKHRKKGVNE